jgi:hypothetical protein
VNLLLICAALVLVWLYRQGVSNTGTAVQSDNTAGSVADYMNVRQVSEAIAKMEGFFVPGSLPSRSMNPGDIGTYGGKVRSYPTVEAGFSALDAYISQHAAAHPDWDLYDFTRYYLTGDTMGVAGPGQNPDSYAEFVAGQLGVDPTTPLSQLLG